MKFGWYPEGILFGHYFFCIRSQGVATLWDKCRSVSYEWPGLYGWMDGWISPDGVKYRAAYSAKNDMKQPKFLPSYRNWPLCKEEESWKVLRKVLFANKIWHWQLWPTESGREVGTKRCTCVNVTKCHRQYIFSGQCHQRQILPFVWYFWVSLSTMTNALWHWHQKIYWKLQN